MTIEEITQNARDSETIQSLTGHHADGAEGFLQCVAHVADYTATTYGDSPATLRVVAWMYLLETAGVSVDGSGDEELSYLVGAEVARTVLATLQ